MKQEGYKKVLSLLLAAILLSATAPFAAFGLMASAKTYQTGDYVVFGSYPQSTVYSYDEIYAQLEAQPKSWKSYGYYSGNSNGYSLEPDNPMRDGQMKPGDFMRYADFSYDGERYRAVIFDAYRPGDTGFQPSTDAGYQKDNGYSGGTVYYFKYEPIVWRVLDPKTGLVMSESLLDAQPFNNTIYYDREYWQTTEKTTYANDYEKSSIRQWLLNAFYQTAFTAKEKAEIGVTTLKNGGAELKDSLFLLSSDDLQNASYGFTGTACYAYGTAYARCQGLRVQDYPTASDAYTSCFWWLRTPAQNSSSAYAVIDGGKPGDSYYSVSYTFYGVRPAFCFRNAIADSREPNGNPGAAFRLGDVSGDGLIKASDARLALRAAVGMETLGASSAQFLAADVNGDGAIKADDARRILRAAVGLQTLQEAAPSDALKAQAMKAYQQEVERVYQINLGGRNADTTSFNLYDFDENGMPELILYGGYKTELGGAMTFYTYTRQKGLVEIGSTSGTSAEFADHTKGDNEFDLFYAYHGRCWAQRCLIENEQLVTFTIECGHIQSSEFSDAYLSRYAVLETGSWIPASDAAAYFAELQ